MRKNTKIARQTLTRRGKHDDILTSFDKEGNVISKIYIKKGKPENDEVQVDHTQDNTEFLRPSEGRFLPPTQWKPENDDRDENTARS